MFDGRPVRRGGRLGLPVQTGAEDRLDALIGTGIEPERCCMDHPEGCLIMVFFNTGDNLDAT